MEKLGLWGRGKNLAEIETLTVTVKVMQGARRVVQVLYLAIVAFILLAAGIIAIVVDGVTQFQNTGTVSWDPILFMGTVLASISVIASIWLLSEQRWITAFNLDKRVENAVRPTLAPHENAESR